MKTHATRALHTDTKQEKEEEAGELHVAGLRLS
jgi:hypothetical protein